MLAGPDFLITGVLEMFWESLQILTSLFLNLSLRHINESKAIWMDEIDHVVERLRGWEWDHSSLQSH